FFGTAACCFVAGTHVHADSYSAPVAPAPTASQPVGPAPYKLERWDENYSYLKDPAQRTDFFDPIKYIPLAADGDWYLTFDRYESFNHNNFGAGPQDRDGYNLARLSVYADLHYRDSFRVFAEVRGAFENGRTGGPRGADLDQLDLQQGFADFTLPINSTTKV